MAGIRQSWDYRFELEHFSNGHEPEVAAHNTLEVEQGQQQETSALVAAFEQSRASRRVVESVLSEHKDLEECGIEESNSFWKDLATYMSASRNPRADYMWIKKVCESARQIKDFLHEHNLKRLRRDFVSGVRSKHRKIPVTLLLACGSPNDLDDAVAVLPSRFLMAAAAHVAYMPGAFQLQTREGICPKDGSARRGDLYWLTVSDDPERYASHVIVSETLHRMVEGAVDSAEMKGTRKGEGSASSAPQSLQCT